MEPYKIIALFGQSGAGKNKVLQDLVENISNAHRIINCTTRPRRANETQNIDYHFITAEEFTEKVIEGSMIEATCFNNWWYGTTFDELQENATNIGIFNIQAIDCLLADSRLKLAKVQVWANDKTRLMRSLQRELTPNCQEICRRFLADQNDFKSKLDFFDYYYYCNNDNMTFEQNKNLINEILYDLWFELDKTD